MPYRQKDGEDNVPDNLELHTANHVHENYDLYEDEDPKQTIRPTRAVDIMATTLHEPAGYHEVEDSRSGRYYQFRDRADTVKETDTGRDEIRLEGSESTTQAPSTNRFPFGQRQTTYVTKTLLVTKLEKYTDHRVTATMIAHNCIPVDPSIQRCRGYFNPIYAGPIQSIHKTEIEKAKKGKDGSLIIASIIHPKPGVPIQNHEILAAVEAVNQASLNFQNRRPGRPHVIPPLFSGTLGIQLGDDVQNEEKVTANDKIDEAPIVEEADPKEGQEETTISE